MNCIGISWGQSVPVSEILMIVYENFFILTEYFTLLTQNVEWTWENFLNSIQIINKNWIWIESENVDTNETFVNIHSTFKHNDYSVQYGICFFTLYSLSFVKNKKWLFDITGIFLSSLMLSYWYWVKSGIINRISSKHCP